MREGSGCWFNTLGFLFIFVSCYHLYNISRWLVLLTNFFLISLVIFYGFHTSVCVFVNTHFGLIKYRNVKGHFYHHLWLTLVYTHLSLSLSKVCNKKQSSRDIVQMFHRRGISITLANPLWRRVTEFTLNVFLLYYQCKFVKYSLENCYMLI